ncbi:MAG: hypothetical protein H6Q07_3213, partial [Acidobacteria bacterium]|nr:hypothetical protein [Acidobacteriota bacterium]
IVEVLGDSDSAGAAGEQPPVVSPAEVPEEAARGDAPVFDLKEAVSRCFGKYEFFLEMVDCFFSETDEMVHLMHEARRQGKADEVRTVAHRLKNTIVYLCAQPATQAVLDVEGGL